MSLSDAWAESLGDVELSYLYRTLNRLIEGTQNVPAHALLKSKGEQDTAWAVKHEFERRFKENNGVPPGVWLTPETC